MYKFHKDRGLLNDDDQIVQIVKSHCSEKERIRLGKLLADTLNAQAHFSNRLKSIAMHKKPIQPPPAPDKHPKSIETISDGFGSVWAKKCPHCGKNKMVVVRPGKAQCDNCE